MTQLVKPVKKIRKQFLRKLDGKRSPQKTLQQKPFTLTLIYIHLSNVSSAPIDIGEIHSPTNYIRPELLHNSDL